MTEIDLTSRSGDYCAPITELEQKVPVFRKNSIRYEEKDYTLANAIRHTAVKTEPASTILHCQNVIDKGVIAALHDPIGEIQDLLGLIAVHSMTLANYIQEHQYPLMIGKGVKNYKDKGEVKTTSWGVEGWGPLSTEFEAHYTPIQKHAETLETAQQNLMQHWANLFQSTARGTLQDFFANWDTIQKRFSLSAHPFDHSETISYGVIMLARLMQGRAISHITSAALGAIFTGVPNTKTPTGYDKAKTIFEKAISGLKNVIDAHGKAHALMPKAVNAFFSVYGTEIVQAANSGVPNATRQLSAQIYRQRRTNLSIDQLRSTFQDLLAADGFTNVDFPTVNQAQALTTQATASTLLTEAAEGRINVVEFHAQIDIDIDASQISHTNWQSNFDIGANGLGIVAAGLTLHASISGYNNPNRNITSVGRFAGNPATQIIAAVGDAWSSYYNLRQAVVTGRGSQAASNAVLSRVFGSNSAFANAAASNASSSSRALAFANPALATKIVGGFGVLLSGFMAVERLNREDYTGAVGNFLMAAGGLVLLFVTTGPLALVAAVCIVVGFIITLFQDSDAESWVRLGFWGSSDEYWAEGRDTITAQINEAKVLADPNHKDYSRIKAFFEAELAAYLDLNSDLVLVDKRSGDGAIEIECGTLQSKDDLERLEFSVSISRSRPRRSERQSIQNVEAVFISPGLVQLRIPNGNYPATHQKVNIRVTLGRLPNGEFNKSLSISRSELWGAASAPPPQNSQPPQAQPPRPFPGSRGRRIRG